MGAGLACAAQLCAQACFACMAPGGCKCTHEAMFLVHGPCTHEHGTLSLRLLPCARFKPDNILVLVLDLPERTTFDLHAPGMDRDRLQVCEMVKMDGHAAGMATAGLPAHLLPACSSLCITSPTLPDARLTRAPDA